MIEYNGIQLDKNLTDFMISNNHLLVSEKKRYQKLDIGIYKTFVYKVQSDRNVIPKMEIRLGINSSFLKNLSNWRYSIITTHGLN